MTGRAAFARSVWFAAGAGAGWPPWVLGAEAVLGRQSALALYLTAVSAAYAGAVLAPARGGGDPPMTPAWVAALLAVAAAAAVAGIARTPAELAIGMAAALGLARSILYRVAPARRVATELMLLGGGLLFARFLIGPSLLSSAVAIWGFLLVQSLFFLLPGICPHPRPDVAGDAFEEAHRRALALLERVDM